MSSPVHLAYCLGTRPEVIRSAKLLRLAAADETVRLTLINTAQHYDHNMMGTFLDELELPAISVSLDVGSGEGPAQTAMVLERTAAVLSRDRPDIVAVFGDTNSSLGCALAAVKQDLPVVHIEAGCRSFDMSMPEELNRRVIDHISSLLLPVSELGRSNLVSEKVPGQIVVTGDPLYDVFLSRESGPDPGVGGPVGLVTLHRPSNVDDADRLALICSELESAARDNGIRWVFPVHPRTRRLLPALSDSVTTLEPLAYDALLSLLAASRICVTDSGGLQKEALWARVPCVTVRTTTEWMETIWQRANVLAPPESGLASAIRERLSDAVIDFANPYGDGQASGRILDAIKAWVADSRRRREFIPPRQLGRSSVASGRHPSPASGSP